MYVKLVRRSFKDDPKWQVIDDSVPIGTVYEVREYHYKSAILVDRETGNKRIVSVYYVIGNGGEGYMPIDIFERMGES